MNPFSDRAMPHSLDSEKSVLGAMILDAGAARTVRDMLATSDFYHAGHRAVYSEIVSLLEDQIPVDLVLLSDRLRTAGKLDEVGGAAALTDCVMACPSPGLAERYARVVAEKSLQRNVITTASEIARTAFESTEPGALATDAVAAFSKLHDQHATGLGIAKSCPFKSMKELEGEFADFVTREHTRTLSLHGWLPTLARRAGLTTLVPGEVLVLVGDTGTGKTAWAQNLARCVAPQPVAFFSMELPGTKVFRRYVQLDQGMTGDAVWQAYKAGETIRWNGARLNHIWTCEESGLTVAGIRHRLQTLAKKLGRSPTLTIVDYMQLLQGRGKRYERTSDAAEDLKVMAKQEQTIVAVLSQVQRPEDKQAMAKPGLHSGKDSGSIENSAGLLLSIERDPEGEGDKSKMRIKVCKQTDGQAGEWIDCRYDGALMRIEELADSRTNPEWERERDR